MRKIAVVVISNTTREYDREYHYLVPEALRGGLLPGMRVIVPFGKSNRTKEGYVLGFTEGSDFEGLKEIQKVIDNKPVLIPSLIKLAVWMKQRYFCTYSQAIKCMLPAGIGVKSLRFITLSGAKAQNSAQRQTCGQAQSSVQVHGSTHGQSSAQEQSSTQGQSSAQEQSSTHGQNSAQEQSSTQGQSSTQVQEGIKLTPNQKILIDLLKANDGSMEAGELRKLYGTRSGYNKNINELAEKGAVTITERYSSPVREKTIRAASLAMPAEEVLADIESGQLKRIQQIRVLEMLMDNEYIAVTDLARFASVSVSVLDTLRKYGYIYYRDIEVQRDPMRHREVEPTVHLDPTPEQKAVLEEAMCLIDSRSYSEMLLHGVTGSGKTEVYLQLIQHVIDSCRQAIVLVPEISLTPQMVDRFRGRFGARVAVMHSRLSPGERYDQWRQIREGAVSIVIGARSAIFAPFSDLGLVIIDEEHENTYKSETTPKYTAAQIAAMRCSYDGALLMYGSATPSTETYQRAIDGEIGLAVMKGRANTALMPRVDVVDMRRELEIGNRSIFSSVLQREIKKNIQAGQQTILFLNKRGYASFVLCRSCGIRLKCRHCNITMTYHSVDDRLICHYCGYTVKMPDCCPKCGSGHIRQFGTGTQKVEEELHKYFPEASVIRMDMDTTTGKHSHQEILDAFRNENINILVGTQMIAKGHDFPNVTLVGVLAADSLLGMDDYRASERTFQLLTQVAGRAGRGKLPGRAVIQTYNTEDYSITTACRHDFDSFFKKEAQIRQRLHYPPFTCIGVAVISSVNDKLAFAKAREVSSFLASGLDAGAGDTLLPGPARAPLSRIRNRYRWRVIVKCGSQERLAELLSGLTDFFAKKKGRDDVDLSVDINPVSML